MACIFISLGMILNGQSILLFSRGENVWIIGYSSFIFESRNSFNLVDSALSH